MQKSCFSLAINCEIVHARKKKCEEGKNHLEESLKQQLLHNQQLERQINNLKVESGPLVKDRKRHLM